MQPRYYGGDVTMGMGNGSGVVGIGGHHVGNGVDRGIGMGGGMGMQDRDQRREGKGFWAALCCR